ncbi:MAG: hypothetical protein HZC54_00530 [Verrucomicrobia bacterium]|nr:hypothetical protein [Verrucomicrobiota bacterium]
MSRPDWDYIKGCFSLTPKERVVVIAAAAVLALGAAVKYWRESRAPVGPAAVPSAAATSLKK